MIRRAMLAAALVLAPALSCAQKGATSTWDVFGGVNVVRSSTIGSPGNYGYGWAASIANEPYDSHPWIGGVIEGSGIYTSGSGATLFGAYTVNSNQYTAMAGPVFVLPHHTLRPFAHALVGGAIIDQTVTGANVNSEQTNDYFIHALGGGLDLPLHHHVFVRAQADWMHIWQTNAANNDMLRLCGGLVWSY